PGLSGCDVPNAGDAGALADIETAADECFAIGGNGESPDGPLVAFQFAEMLAATCVPDMNWPAGFGIGGFSVGRQDSGIRRKGRPPQDESWRKIRREFVRGAIGSHASERFLGKRVAERICPRLPLDCTAHPQQHWDQNQNRSAWNGHLSLSCPKN